MIPKNHLENLLLQAVKNQRESNLMMQDDDEFEENTTEGIPLLYDESFKSKNISVPSRLICTLEDHNDEVWVCKFSNNGEWLASGGSDSKVYLYKTLDLLSNDNTQQKFTHSLSAHNGNISLLAFSPDDKLLISCCTANEVGVWDVLTGQQISHSKKSTPIISCLWETVSSYMTVSGEKNSQVSFWDAITGSLIDSFKVDTRAQDAVLTGDDRLIVATYDKQLLIFSIKDKRVVDRILENEYITSLTANKTSRFILSSLSMDEDCPSEIHLWDLKEKRLVLHYTGNRQSKFILKPTFVGNHLVACGSEDSKIYIWDRTTGKLIDNIVGHINVVNSVAWNRQFNLLASGSDDSTVKIWGMQH